ncbi:MAG: uroporphyrinogen-III synthase [Gammaproteobacteria bacterium]|nr:MAG: uroporphyrinogen-III synthase [Gammaproteobacteria bacterium]
MNASPKARAQSLKGVGVLVTRPAQQAAELCELIEEQGGRALLFPVLEIVAAEESPALLDLVDRLDEFDIAIFISANAVDKALSLILARRPLPAHLQLAVVGNSTARQLQEFGIHADLIPAQGFNSEALLALPEMREVHGKNIVIFRGAGGRELLAQALRERGARVEYAEVYRRTKPQADVSALLEELRQNKVQVVTATSSEAVRNLLEMAGKEGAQRLRALPLVVLSARIAEDARALGFKSVTVAQLAGDEALAEAVVQAVRRRYT